MPVLYTDKQLGFHCDDSLRAGISSTSAHEVVQSLLVQIARQNESIQQKLGIVGPIADAPSVSETVQAEPVMAPPIPAPVA